MTRIDIDIFPIDFTLDRRQKVRGKVKLYSECAEDPNLVQITAEIDGDLYTEKAGNFFEALQRLRLRLEKNTIQICCNGAAETVYPSFMQLDMGDGQLAYKQTLGKPARTADIVGIFDCEEGLNFTTVKAQKDFHAKWLQSKA